MHTDFPTLTTPQVDVKTKGRFRPIPKNRWTKLQDQPKNVFIQNVNQENGSKEPVKNVYIQANEYDQSSRPNPGMDITFQVAEAKKPLLSVRRVIESGNSVHFGPGDRDNFIQNMIDGRRIYMHKRGEGSYIMAVNMPGVGPTEITVDSGAEESVCPWSWGVHFGTRPCERSMNLLDAQGNSIAYYGTRTVLVVDPF